MKEPAQVWRELAEVSRLAIALAQAGYRAGLSSHPVYVQEWRGARTLPRVAVRRVRDDGPEYKASSPSIR